MGIGFKTLFVFALAASAAFANEDLRFADSCYAARAERAKGDKADAHNAKLMIDAYHKATSDASVEEAATEGYVKSLFFSFRFVPFDKSKRARKLDSLKTASEDAYGKFPKNKEIAHIYASALSMWGADKNPLQAVKDGVAAKVRDVATAAEDYQVMDSYLDQGDYGKFVGYYSANDIGIVYENPYQGLEMAAYAYVDLMRYVAALNDSSSFWYKPNRIGDTCEYIAEDLNRIYTLEDRYSDDIDRYLPADKRVYYDDLCNRTAAIAKAYFGLTDKDIEDIPNLSKKKLAAMIEEGIAS